MTDLVQGEVLGPDNDLEPLTGTDLERRVGDLDRQIGQMLAAATAMWPHFARAYWEFSQRRGWELINGPDSTLDDWLREREIERTRFRRLVKFHQELVVNRGVPADRLARINPSKLQDVLPAVKDGTVDLDEALSDTETYARAELRLLDRYATSRVDDGGDDDRVPCPGCGTFVSPERLEKAA